MQNRPQFSFFIPFFVTVKKVGMNNLNFCNNLVSFECSTKVHLNM